MTRTTLERLSEVIQSDQKPRKGGFAQFIHWNESEKLHYLRWS